MIERRTIEITDLNEIIFLMNHDVPIFMELACNYMHIDDAVHPWKGCSLYLSGKAEQDFYELCEAGAIGGLDTGKSYLEHYCLWDTQIHGKQSEEGNALAKKFNLGKEFVDSP
jgi:hypothetical protein